MNVTRKKCDAVGCDHGYVTLLFSRKKCSECNGTGEIVKSNPEEVGHSSDGAYYSNNSFSGTIGDVACSGGAKAYFWGIDSSGGQQTW